MRLFFQNNLKKLRECLPAVSGRLLALKPLRINDNTVIMSTEHCISYFTLIMVAHSHQDINYFILYLREWRRYVELEKHTGKSLTNYILNQKISEAKRLMWEGSLKIKDIASAVGYEDNNYFSRIFREKTGYSPLEYKKYII